MASDTSSARNITFDVVSGDIADEVFYQTSPRFTSDREFDCRQSLNRVFLWPLLATTEDNGPYVSDTRKNKMPFNCMQLLILMLSLSHSFGKPVGGANPQDVPKPKLKVKGIHTGNSIFKIVKTIVDQAAEKVESEFSVSKGKDIETAVVPENGIKQERICENCVTKLRENRMGEVDIKDAEGKSKQKVTGASTTKGQTTVLDKLLKHSTFSAGSNEKNHGNGYNAFTSVLTPFVDGSFSTSANLFGGDTKGYSGYSSKYHSVTVGNLETSPQTHLTTMLSSNKLFDEPHSGRHDPSTSAKLPVTTTETTPSSSMTSSRTLSSVLLSSLSDKYTPHQTIYSFSPSQPSESVSRNTFSFSSTIPITTSLFLSSSKRISNTFKLSDSVSSSQSYSTPSSTSTASSSSPSPSTMSSSSIALSSFTIGQSSVETFTMSSTYRSSSSRSSVPSVSTMLSSVGSLSSTIQQMSSSVKSMRVSSSIPYAATIEQSSSLTFPYSSLSSSSSDFSSSSSSSSTAGISSTVISSASSSSSSSPLSLSSLSSPSSSSASSSTFSSSPALSTSSSPSSSSSLPSSSPSSSSV